MRESRRVAARDGRAGMRLPNIKRLFLRARPRGTGNLGFYDTERGEQPIPIRSARLAADMPEAERPQFEVMRTDTDTFSAFVTGRANRGGTFFNLPAGGVDLCNVNVPVRRRP